MQTTSLLYRTLLAQEAPKEWRLSINGTIYGQSVIVKKINETDCSPQVSRPMFMDSPSIGGCYAAQFTCTLLLESLYIPRMATIVPSYRLCLNNQTSEWITVGTFYVDVRKYDRASRTTQLVCYDDMLKADGEEGKTYAQLTAFTEWPQAMSSVVQEICTLMGVSLDSRTVINSGTGYTIGYPNEYTMREILGFVAAAHGGNCVITPSRTLRIVPLTGNTDAITVIGASDLVLSEPFPAWSKVILYYAEQTAYEAGTASGRTIEADEPWAEQQTANSVLLLLSGYSYQPFSIQTILADPAVELGDTVIIPDGTSSVTLHVWGIELVCDSTGVQSFSAPGESAIDHEYPYASSTSRQFKKVVKLGQSYYGVSINKQNGLEIKRSDGTSEALFNSDAFAMRALIDGVMRDRIYFDPIKGDYVFDGALGAAAVFTDSLYAETGDVAELTVDRLSTSRRIRKYILQDTSDDNYILIQDQYLRFITGTPSALSVLLTESWLPLLTEGGEQLLATSDTYATVQARNRYGELLYWQREPVSHTAAGYPLDEDGVQIYASTTESDWPVYMYSYTEQVKAEFAFNLENGVYVPQIVLGAGDENGRTIGRIHKSPDGMDWIFTTSSGEEIGLKAWSSGFMDIYGLRKTTEMDFSAWDSGSFTEKLDGNKQAMYFVTFDSQSRPVKITDGSGHETAVVW